MKHWSSGEMGLRWTASGMLEAERQFRRIIGHRELVKLCVAIDREHERTTIQTPTKDAVMLIRG